MALDAVKRPAPAVLSPRAASRLNLVKPSEHVGGHLHMLVYGEPGVGKTMFAGTAEDDPRSAPVLFCDAEGGMLPIRRRGKAMDVFEITDFRTAFDKLYRAFYDQKGYVGFDEMPYRTVVIDSLSEMYDLAMLAVIREAHAKRQRDNPDVPEIQDYNHAGKIVERLLRFLRDLPLHLVVTALERNDADNVTGITKYAPALPNKLAHELPGMFDTVAHMTVKQVKQGDKVSEQRVLQLQKTSRVIAKDRAGTGLPREVYDPTVAKMLDRLEQV